MRTRLIVLLALIGLVPTSAPLGGRVVAPFLAPLAVTLGVRGVTALMVGAPGHGSVAP